MVRTLVVCVMSLLLLPTVALSWTPPPPPGVVVVQPEPVRPHKHGPPAHAPAWGNRAKRAYRYYPEERVYFRPDTEEWFWMEAGAWRMGLRLPPRIVVTNPVDIQVEGDKPYRYHKDHSRQYPPGQLKKMRQGDDDDGPGRGHGKWQEKGKGHGKGKGWKE